MTVELLDFYACFVLFLILFFCFLFLVYLFSFLCFFLLGADLSCCHICAVIAMVFSLNQVEDVMFDLIFPFGCRVNCFAFFCFLHGLHSDVVLVHM